MTTATTYCRWLGLILVTACLAGTAYGQNRTVTLTLNTATIPDTTNTQDFIEVRGAGNGTAPFTLIDGNMIDWSDVSTLEPENIGGDYWRITFQIADTTDLTFKFYSQQTQDAGLDGWEADPNPNIPVGVGDTTLTTHFFEAQAEYRGVSGDRGPYDWRPFESKEDSVAIWFRVAMYGQETTNDSYDPAATAPAQQIGVRGDNMDINGDQSVLSPIDWGSTNVVLTRESSNANAPGYRIYSGVGYYPKALSGMRQAYKFVIDNAVLNDDQLAWEEGNVPPENRGFIVPENDSTLHWVYYGDTAPSPTQPVTSNIVFGVDLTPFEDIGLFDRARGDTLWVLGGFNAWGDCRTQTPDQCLMEKEPGGNTFAAAVPITRPPNVELQYKYFLDFNDENFRAQFGVDPPSGWEEGHQTGINRRFVFAGDAQQTLDLAFFNDVTPDNLLGPGASVDVTFTVDMAPAVANDAQPFDPAGGDSVSVRLGDPIWAYTQGFDGSGMPNIVRDFQLEDPDGDGVYEGTLTVADSSYNIITFKYLYGQGGTYFDEPGGDTSTPGRNRTYFIPQNADGSWPPAYAIPPDSFRVAAGPLPFENNPNIDTAIEEIDSEVPEAIWLGANYPNPFNPTTTFEYALDRTQAVKIRVYDMLGRLVATLVDGVQQPATYQVTFDASHLASGVYLYRLETANRSFTKRMLLIK